MFKWLYITQMGNRRRACIYYCINAKIRIVCCMRPDSSLPISSIRFFWTLLQLMKIPFSSTMSTVSKFWKPSSLPGLRVLLERCHWEVLMFSVARQTNALVKGRLSGNRSSSSIYSDCCLGVGRTTDAKSRVLAMFSMPRTVHNVENDMENWSQSLKCKRLLIYSIKHIWGKHKRLIHIEHREGHFVSSVTIYKIP